MKHKTLSYYFGFLLAFGFFTSCSEDTLPEFTNLDKLRIVAIELSAPEVNPGVTVTVTPWVSDITETTGLFDSVSVCVDPGVSFGAQPTCDGNPTKVDIRSNQSLTITGSNFTGPANSFAVTVPLDAIIFANKTSQDQWNGVSYLIDYRLRNSLGVEVKSIRRLLVSTPSKAIKNSNPVATDVLSNSVSMTSYPTSGAQVSLTTDLNGTSIESYQRMKSDGSFETISENLLVTWMITDGETNFARSSVGSSVLFTGPTTAPVGRLFHLLAVARDDRGGVKIVKKEF